MSIFQSKKDQLLNEMNSINKSLFAAANNRIKYAEAWQEMGNSFAAMLLTQCPSRSNFMDKFISYFNEIKDIQMRIAEAEIRNAEDFRDVEERFAVLYRVNSEYITAKNAFKTASEQLKVARKRKEVESAKPNFEQNRVKLESAIEKCRSDASRALEDVKAKLKNLIDYRDKYNRFKVRRFCQGWTKYGMTLKVESDNEGAVLSKLQDLLEEMKNTTEINEEDLNKMESALEKHISEEPQPVQVPSPNDEIPEDEQDIE